MAYAQPEDETIAVERPQRVEPLPGREGVAGVDARDRAAELELCGLAKSKPRDRQRLEAARLRIPERLIAQPLDGLEEGRDLVPLQFVERGPKHRAARVPLHMSPASDHTRRSGELTEPSWRRLSKPSSPRELVGPIGDRRADQPLVVGPGRSTSTSGTRLRCQRSSRVFPRRRTTPKEAGSSSHEVFAEWACPCSRSWTLRCARTASRMTATRCSNSASAMWSAATTPGPMSIPARPDPSRRSTRPWRSSWRSPAAWPLSGRARLRKAVASSSWDDGMTRIRAPTAGQDSRTVRAPAL